MKKIVMILFLCGCTSHVTAQSTYERLPKVSVEKSIFGIQTGFAGVWLYSELKISHQVTLRSELGLDAYHNDDFFPDTGFLLTTSITIEPRWYYNLMKRKSKSKRIDNNSGNFFALRTSLRPDDLLINLGDDDNTRIITNLSIIPTWGIRRNIGSHFNYETGIGVGYIHYFSKNSGFAEDSGETAINLHLRIGYKF